MKKTLLTTISILSVLMIASMAWAQGGSLGLFADVTGGNCNLLDTVSGLCNVFVVHVNSTAISASEFGVSAPACLLASFLSYTAQFGVDIACNPSAPLEGRSVGYGACRSGPVHVATIGYFCMTTTGPCCLQGVIDNACSGKVEAVDCSSNLIPAGAGEARWNPDGTCMCNVATQASTWGAVKELFQQNP